MLFPTPRWNQHKNGNVDMNLCTTRLRTRTNVISVPRKDISLADTLQPSLRVQNFLSMPRTQPSNPNGMFALSLPVRSWPSPPAASGDCRLAHNYPELQAGVSSECRNINNHAKPELELVAKSVALRKCRSPAERQARSEDTLAHRLMHITGPFAVHLFELGNTASSLQISVLSFEALLPGQAHRSHLLGVVCQGALCDTPPKPKCRPYFGRGGGRGAMSTSTLPSDA